MRTKALPIVMSALVGIVAVAGSLAFVTGQESMPAADAKDVWTYITKTNATRFRPRPRVQRRDTEVRFEKGYSRMDVGGGQVVVLKVLSS